MNRAMLIIGILWRSVAASLSILLMLVFAHISIASDFSNIAAWYSFMLGVIMSIISGIAACMALRGLLERLRR